MKVKVKVAISANADEWCLYRMPGAAEVARKLSVAASGAITQAHKIYSETKDIDTAVDAAINTWNGTSEAFSEFGAMDSEPRWFFRRLLNIYFKSTVVWEYGA